MIIPWTLKTKSWGPFYFGGLDATTPMVFWNVAAGGVGAGDVMGMFHVYVLSSRRGPIIRFYQR